MEKHVINHDISDIREAMGVRNELDSIVDAMQEFINSDKVSTPSDMIQICIDEIAKMDMGNGKAALSEYEMHLLFIGLTDGHQLDMIIGMKQSNVSSLIENMLNNFRGENQDE